MEKIFSILAVFTALILANANPAFSDVEQPKLPVNLNEFQLFNSAHVPCGTLDFFAYQENENVIWMAAYLDRHQFLNPYHIARLTVLAEENWFDVNRDGIINMLDYSCLSSVFNRTVPDQEYNSKDCSG